MVLRRSITPFDQFIVQKQGHQVVKLQRVVGFTIVYYPLTCIINTCNETIDTCAHVSYYYHSPGVL